MFFFQFWITWMSPWDSNWLLWRRTTTDTCHEIPRLPKQSDCDSRYFLGRNFMAQCGVIKTDSMFRFWRISNLDWSCLTVQSWCVLHAWIISLLCCARYRASSLPSFNRKEACSTNSWMSSDVEVRPSHSEQCSSLMCWHFPLNELSLVSLIAYTIYSDRVRKIHLLHAPVKKCIF